MNETLKQILLSGISVSDQDFVNIKKSFQQAKFIDEITSTELKRLVTDDGNIEIEDIFEIEKRKNITDTFQKIDACIEGLENKKDFSPFILFLKSCLLSSEKIVIHNLIVNENKKYLSEIDFSNPYKQALYELKVLPYKHVVELSNLDNDFLNVSNMVEYQNLKEKKQDMTIRHIMEANRAQKNVVLSSYTSEKESIIKELDEQYKMYQQMKKQERKM